MATLLTAFSLLVLYASCCPALFPGDRQGKEETEVPPKADYASLKVQNDIRTTRATGNSPYRVHDLLTHKPSTQVPYFLRQRIFRNTVKSPKLQLLIERLLQKDTVRERVIISYANHTSKKG
ncbi:hypothetical protein ASPFODRAFT_54587 [Aspergillus luchuensis CBS 106.47]|uniref:Uncharacterized protein n=1 Tax=Aspergillus luchuensis (strain CBS 106.47) TaxID=1137211 RepID=A0A1M3SZ56_ASPLC|nr:hypothetical protein ASPFODRAFT_54587 [Aspergillus luchuensis CBS 106.47]